MPARASCTCAEGYWDPEWATRPSTDESGGGVPLPEPARSAHDCDYIAWRNSLIPRAEARAYRELGRPVDAVSRAAYNQQFTTAFSRHMEALVREEG